jgi:DNA polymerase III sliding clamp (beta) subunit (PCNA family)
MTNATAPVRFTIAAAVLAPLAAAAARFIQRRNTVPILSNTLITVEAGGAVSMMATDLDVQGVVTAAEDIAVDMAGSFTVDGHMLADLAGKAAKTNRGAVVTIAVEDGRAAVTYGNARQSLAVLPVDDFPAVAHGETAFAFAIDGDTLAADLARLSSVMGNDETRYYLKGIAVEAVGDTLRMTATDGWSAVTITRPLPIGAADLPSLTIPRDTVKHLAHALKARPGVMVGARFSGSVGVLAMPGLTMTTKLVDGTFPDVARQYPVAPPANRLTIDARALSGRMAAAAARSVGGKGRLLTIEAAPDRIRAGWPMLPATHGYAGDAGTAATLAATFEGEAGAIMLPAPSAAMFKAMRGDVVLAWDAVDGVALLTDETAPEFAGLLKLTAGSALPSTVLELEPIAYTAPAGQAADLFGACRLGGDNAGGVVPDGPRKACKLEVAAYLADYATRAGLPTDGGRKVIYAASHDHRAGVALGMMVGVQTAEARNEVVEVLDWNTLTTSTTTVNHPIQYSDGAYCVVMPGTCPAPVMVDTGEGYSPTRVDAKGAISLDADAVREAVGEIAKPVKVKAARKVAAKSPAQPATVVEAPTPAADPVPTAGGALPSAVVAAAINAGEYDSPVVDRYGDVEAAPPVDDADPLASILARLAALEAAAAPVVAPEPAQAAPARDRSAARVRMIRAYLRMRADRAAVRAHIDRLTAERDEARARAAAGQVKRGRALAGVRRTRAALSVATIRLAAANGRATDACERADRAERLARLGAAGDLPAPRILIDPTDARRFEAVRS